MSFKYPLRFILLIFLLCTFEVSAQSEMIYTQYAVKDGLTSTHINRLTAGRMGFLWISTDHGFSRFDGQNFRNFGIAEGLTHQNVYGIAQTLDSVLWICTRGGGLYTLKAGIIKPYLANHGKIPNNLTDILVDGKENKWIIDENKNVGYLRNGIYKAVTLPVGTSEVYELYPKDDGSILLATNNGIYSAKDGHVDGLALLKGKPIYSVEQSKSGILYCGSKGIVYTLVKERLIDSIKVPNCRIVQALAIYNEEVFGLTDGTGFFRIKDKKFTREGSNAELSDLLIDDLIFDDEGGLHLATFGKGLFSISSFDIHRFTKVHGLLHENISALAEDNKGRIFAGTYGGVSIIDKDSVVQVLRNIKSDEMVTGLLFQNGKMHQGQMMRIHRFDRFFSSDHNPKDILVMEADGDSLWAGTWQGLWKGSAHCKPPLYCSKTVYPQLREKTITALKLDAENNLWVGTNKELFEFKKNGSYVQYKDLPSDRINAISVDEKGEVFVATNNGLFFIEAGKWKKYPALMNLVCGALLLTKDGTLWIGTTRGVYFLDGNKEIQKFSAFPDVPVNAIFEDSQNKIWLGTDDGLYWVPAGVRKERLHMPKVYIMRLATEKEDYYNLQGQVFDYRDNDIQVNFLAIDFLPKQDILYQYKINDDTEWQEVANRNIQFSNLSPGFYRIRVRAHFKGNAEFTNIAEADFRINKPLWQKLWFLISLFLLITLLILWLVSKRIARVKRKALNKTRRLNRIIRLRQQAMNALVNPHFIFNSLNSIQHFMNQHDTLSANRYLTKFARLIRRTMDSSSQTFVTLENELERLELYLSLEKMRLGSKLNYLIEVEKIENVANVKIPSMLIQPYVENAIWHGVMPLKEGGTVKILLKHESQLLKIIIEDDGVGIKLPTEKSVLIHDKKRRGMQINGDRLRILDPGKSKITITNLEKIGEGRGTRVEIQMSYLTRSKP